jgi:hypothetical protein
MRNEAFGSSNYPFVDPVVRRQRGSDMKNVLLSSPEFDRKIFAGLAVIEAFTVAAIAGYVIPTPLENLTGRLLNAGISLGLAVLVWGCFRLFEPGRYSYGWAVAKLIAVPLLWLVLFLAVIIWIHQTQAGFIELMDEVRSGLNRVSV